LAAAVAAVTNVLPVAGPLLSPFERLGACCTNFWSETVFSFRHPLCL
jgi:hypothetical protein